MNGITHKQAKTYMHAELDGLLTDTQRRDLDAHLRECEGCRVESESLSMLTARLRSNFQARWDTQDGPSQNVLTSVLSRKRRIVMSNRINSGFKVFSGIAALLVLGFIINLVVSQLHDQSIASSATQINPPVSPEKRLIAFTSTNENGNPDIYTMHADGSNLTNLTNNAAHDINPFWSPDGTRIAFQSDRSGLMQIYIMNVDGSNVTQITNNEVNHELMSQIGPWSPDGKKLLFTEWGAPDTAKWKLYAIDVDGKDKTLLADVPPVYSYLSWSPDGKHVAFVSDSRLYVVDFNGTNLIEITKSLPSGEAVDSYNLPNYYWAPDGKSITFISSNIDSVSGKTQGGEPNVNLFRWNAYEASLDARTLVLNATTHSPLGGWWKGSYFVTPFVGVRPWRWVGSYGVRTVDPFRNCKDLSGGGSRYTASSSGNVAIGAMCPNGDWWLYLVTPQGIMSPLMASPISTTQGSMDRISWSSDGKFVAFVLTSNGKTEMYLVNVIEALKDPSVEPVHVSKGSGTENNLPVWQPQP
jgi:Tol biopolymer transport system component